MRVEGTLLLHALVSLLLRGSVRPHRKMSMPFRLGTHIPILTIRGGEITPILVGPIPDLEQ